MTVLRIGRQTEVRANTQVFKRALTLCNCEQITGHRRRVETASDVTKQRIQLPAFDSLEQRLVQCLVAGKGGSSKNFGGERLLGGGSNGIHHKIGAATRIAIVFIRGQQHHEVLSL
jgi:hypothetical protein